MEKPEPGKILFAVTAQLSGQSPSQMLLRTDESTFTEVETGRSYLVAWTDMSKDLRRKKGWQPDPEGPHTLRVEGLGSATVFEDTPELRFLLAPETMADPATAARQLDSLLVQMQRKEPRSKGLVISELYLREDLAAIMGPEQVTLLRQVLDDPDLSPQLRDLLLRAALRLPRDATAPWLAEEFRRVIIVRGTQYDLASFVPGLVRTAARGLQQSGGPGDVDLLSLLLYANNPGVAKAALAAMDHFDHDAAAEKARQALERGWIGPETQRALQRFLAQSVQ